MIIDGISPFKGSAMCVELADGRKYYLNKNIVADSGLCKDAEISDDEMERLVYRNDLRRARERALYLLEGQDYSYGGLFDKLERSYSEEICFEVCDGLVSTGLLDDRRYARKLCRSLFESKKLGIYRVKREMRVKGIPDEIIDEITDEFSEEDDSFSRLEELVEQKYERFLTDRKGVIKVKNALVRKGYSYDEINEVLDLYDLDFDD